MNDIIVAGINGNQIPLHVYGYIEDTSFPISCSKAHLKIIESNFHGFDHDRWIPIVPLPECFDTVARTLKKDKVLFLISGDPLFFGIGKRLSQHFTNSSIRFIPAVSYMQSCFAHIGLNWDDADFLSLHGRSLESLDHKLNCRKLFIFTDTDNSPDVIARYLNSRRGNQPIPYIVHVGERIGAKNQRFVSGNLDEIEAMSFAQPNSMIVLDTSDADTRTTARFGLSENDIEHSRGLITKSEVRAAVIHKLQLPDNGVLWDIGAGSGSISIEAARLFESLSVYAVERSDEQLENIQANKFAYGCRNLHIVAGQAPEILYDLPQPDRIFIGGSGGRLEDILGYLDERVNAPVRIVATAVLEETARTVPEKLYASGFDVDVSVIETTRYRYPNKNKTTFNPISIICGTR